MKHTIGQHHIIELIDCSNDILRESTPVEAALLKSAHKSGATVLSHHFHQFKPDGVSGVIVISESHFTIHTWPARNYAAVDIFTCSESIDVKRAISLLKDDFGAGRVTHQTIPRGY